MQGSFSISLIQTTVCTGTNTQQIAIAAKIVNLHISDIVDAKHTDIKDSMLRYFIISKKWLRPRRSRQPKISATWRKPHQSSG